MQHSTARQFSGIAKLYGGPAVQLFAQSHIVVVGVGGVGSWVAEALARSGIGHISLIDMDHVSESNINRQLHALHSTLGQAKVATLKTRLLDINPHCKVYAVDEFFERNEPAKHLGSDVNYVIDCIDSARDKAALIAHCKRQKMPIISVGGAGGKDDPLSIRVLDLSRTQKDSLLSKTRKVLRQEYSFSRNLKRRFSVPAVYSIQQPVHYAPDDVAAQRPETGLNCAGYGSVTHMTASLGYVAVAQVLRRLVKEF